ncbi:MULTISPECIES: FxSxx-COOH system tetratricopeptide repeat protein [Streptacidiphilus]|uniref:FxSxx-COOH system tetratricopeptide repeat protein n=1 Tax=Streptacidiphilus cavernicola TaxID=3342716 RepID=A0ABV6UX07_9ACTN|nr:FxSxx-COOH system tetratricopeptide repeat protein [Streptacidiphilus jeojiense]
MTSEYQVEDRGGRIITFYSYKGGTGRTMALANTAWILAANGYRVLTVDWDLEAPGLAHFFRPFLDQDDLAATTGVIDLIMDYRDEALREQFHEDGWHREFATVRRHATSLNWSMFQEGGRLDLLPAGQVRSDYAATVAAINWDHFYAELDGSKFFQAMRTDMRAHYDYVLIDSRTGLSDIADICTVEMPDDLVVCFTLSDQSIEGASAIARTINERYRSRGIRILPVPMRVDDFEKVKADAGRALARQRFGGLPEDMNEAQLAQYWGAVEIPYRPFYAYEEILAGFGDQPGSPTSMLSACERLTAALTRDQVVGLPPMPEDVRLRYADSFTRRRPAIREDIFLSYAPEDRMWADWIEALLTRAGLRVLPREVGADPRAEAERGMDAAARTLVVLSPAYVRSPQAHAVWNSVADFDPAGVRRELIPVRVGDVRLTAPFNNRNQVDVLRLDEAQAASELLRALRRGEQDVHKLLVTGGPRFPGTRPAIWNVKPRNPAFTGRSAILDRLRDQLRGGNPAVVLPTPTTLYGLGGVGKTQVALEYAHRFMADYDLVWWVDAEQPDQVMLSLAELAVKLDLRPGDNAAEAAEAAREALWQSSKVGRWLLIFDNADRPSEIAGFLPGGPGHVLITSRNQAWTGQAEPLPVDVFTRQESVEHLRRRNTGMSRADADRVAEAVGDLPLAVEIAAAWLETTGTPVSSYIAELQGEAVRALTTTQQEVPDYPRRFSATWNVSIARLREQSPAANRLLQLCAYFSAEPIAISLIYNDQMMRSLVALDPDLQESVMLGKVVQAITRYGLAKVDSNSRTFQMHRMVQAVIRSELTTEQQETTMHEVHQILAGARPGSLDIDDWASWPDFERIWPHLGPSLAQDCDESEVRQLLIDRVRYLWKRGELEVAQELGHRLEDAWTAKHGPDDRQTLLLRFQLANVVRSQGRFGEALELDQSTWDRQRRLLGPDHLHSLMTAGSLAGDLRALGRFREAMELDMETYAKLRDTYGELSNRTLLTANNLALDYRFTGDYEAARQLDQETYDKRDAVLGSTHQDTLASKAALAEDLRALGDYEGSVQLLEEFQEAYREVPVTDLPKLRYAKSYAVALRRVGRLGEARQLTRDTYGQYLERYGAVAPDTLACALNLAADYSAAGDKEAARDFAAEVHQGYRESLGSEHPYTLACANNVGIYLRDSGQLAEATALGESTLASMQRVLGPEHPFTLSVMVNLANCYGDIGDLDRAEDLGRTALRGLVHRYGSRHPDVVVCEGNLAVTLRDSGRRAEAVELRGRVVDELIRQFGEEHPMTRNARGWKRNGHDLELQPV